MSFLDFTTIRERLPQRAHVWSALQNWSKAHPQVAAVPVVELMQDLHREVHPPQLLEAINELVAQGKARTVYQVVDPNMKVLLPKVYESRGAVPEKVQDNWEKWIEISPQDIAMVLQPPH